MLSELDTMLSAALLMGKDTEPMRLAASAIDAYCSTNPPVFTQVTARVGFAMQVVGDALRELWDNERYMRAEGAYSLLAE